MYACANGHREVIKALMQHGANAQAKDDREQSPEDHAFLTGNSNVIDLLDPAYLTAFSYYISIWSE